MLEVKKTPKMTTWMTLWRRGLSSSRWKEKISRDQVLTLISGTDEVSTAKLYYGAWASQVRSWTEASHYTRSWSYRFLHSYRQEKHLFWFCLFVCFAVCLNGQHRYQIDFAGVKTRVPAASFSFCQTWMRVKGMRGKAGDGEASFPS